jgi:hypothetical protein
MLFCHYTEDNRSTSAAILGGVLGVLIIGAMVIIIAVSAILCLIKKGITIQVICGQNTIHSLIL